MTTSTHEHELIELETQNWQAIKDNTGAWTLHKFAFEGDVQVRFVNDEVAIVAYRVMEELTVEGKPVTLRAG